MFPEQPCVAPIISSRDHPSGCDDTCIVLKKLEIPPYTEMRRQIRPRDTESRAQYLGIVTARKNRCVPKEILHRERYIKVASAVLVRVQHNTGPLVTIMRRIGRSLIRSLTLRIARRA